MGTPPRRVAEVTIKNWYAQPPGADSTIYIYNSNPTTGPDTAIIYTKIASAPYQISQRIIRKFARPADTTVIQRYTNGQFVNSEMDVHLALNTPSPVKSERFLYKWDGNAWQYSIVDTMLHLGGQSYLHSNIGFEDIRARYDLLNTYDFNFLIEYPRPGNLWQPEATGQRLHNQQGYTTYTSYNGFNIDSQMFVPRFITYTAYSNNLISQHVDVTYEPLTGLFQDSVLTTYTYSANGQRLENITETRIAPNPALLTERSYTYDGMGGIATETIVDHTTARSTRTRYTNLTARHYLSAIGEELVNGTWQTTGSEQCSYNSWKQITRFQTFDENGLPASGMYRYYYENDFAPTLPPGDAIALLLYPVPASNELHINIRSSEAQALELSVTDMQGRRTAQWQLPAAIHHIHTLTTSQYPAGLYTLMVEYNGQRLERKFSVVR